MGRGFAVGGGVAAAVVEAIQQHGSGSGGSRSDYGDGLRECRKMLTDGPGGQAQRLSAGGHGLPRRLVSLGLGRSARSVRAR